MSNVIVFLPAYNEEGRVGKAVSSLLNSHLVDKLFVVNDGSTDETAKEASQSGATVINFKKNLGKGRALKQALLQKINEGEIQDDDIILLVDADTAETALEAEKLVKELKKRGRGHFVIAVFPKPKKKGGFGLAKNLAKYFLRFTTGFEFRAPLSGQRCVFFSDLKNALPAFNYGYGLEVAMSYSLCKQGLIPVEVTLSMTHRETGRNLKDFLHRGKQFLDILRVIIDSRLGRL
ncbi:MAG: glycosyltransferase [Actinobacteria bacterium]|nr:glycosyltransferase [Actinomycetota bacterium]